MSVTKKQANFKWRSLHYIHKCRYSDICNGTIRNLKPDTIFEQGELSQVWFHLPKQYRWEDRELVRGWGQKQYWGTNVLNICTWSEAWYLADKILLEALHFLQMSYESTCEKDQSIAHCKLAIFRTVHYNIVCAHLGMYMSTYSPASFCMVVQVGFALSENMSFALHEHYIVQVTPHSEHFHHTIRGALKWTFWKNLGFCPNQVAPPPPPRSLGHPKLKKNYVFFAF